MMVSVARAISSRWSRPPWFSTLATICGVGASIRARMASTWRADSTKLMPTKSTPTRLANAIMSRSRGVTSSWPRSISGTLTTLAALERAVRFRDHMHVGPLDFGHPERQGAVVGVNAHAGTQLLMKLRVIDRHLLRTVMRQVGSQYQTVTRLERRFDTQLDSADLAPRNIEQDRQFGQGFPNQGNGGLMPDQVAMRAVQARDRHARALQGQQGGRMVLKPARWLRRLLFWTFSFSVVGLHAANMTEICQRL